MGTKPFKPLVLSKSKTTGAAVMWSRRLWDITKHSDLEFVAAADTPEEKASLWDLKDKLNNARKKY